MSQPPKFSLYNAGLQEKLFAMNEDQPSPPRPSSARSRLSAKSAPNKRPTSANRNLRSRGASFKTADHRPSQPMQPAPPGAKKKTQTEAKDAPPDMRPYMVLGKEELLNQIIQLKKKQSTSDSIINQLKAENQRYFQHFLFCNVHREFLRLEGEVSKQQHRIDKILSPQYAKSAHLVLEIRKEIEKSVLVRQLKAQMNTLRATIAEKDSQIDSMYNNINATTLLELSAEKEEYLLEISRLMKIIDQKDEALNAAKQKAKWSQQEQQEEEVGENLRHELDRLTKGYEEVLHRLEIKNSAASGMNNDATSVKSSGSKKSTRMSNRPKSSSSASRPSSHRGKLSKSGTESRNNKKKMSQANSLNELDPQLTTFDASQQNNAGKSNHLKYQDDFSNEQVPRQPLTSINNEELRYNKVNSNENIRNTPNEGLSMGLVGESVDDIPNGGKLQIVADATEGNMSTIIGNLPLGCKVLTNCNGGAEFYPGTIIRYNEDNGTYDIEYEDGDIEKHVKRDHIKVLGEPVKTFEKPVAVEKDEGVKYDFCIGTRVDIIDKAGKDPVMSGTIKNVLRGGKEFDVELDSGVVERGVHGKYLHESLPLANQLHLLSSKQNQAKFSVGDHVLARMHGGEQKHAGVIEKIGSNGYDVAYDNGEFESDVQEDLIEIAKVSSSNEESPTVKTASKSVRRKFKVGQLVEACYHGESWFQGVVAKVRQEGFDIDYNDGEKEYNVRADLIRSVEPTGNYHPNAKFAVGDIVEARYRGKSKWYGGRIARIRSEGYDIDYDDGEKEYNVFEDIIRFKESTMESASPREEQEEKPRAHGVGDKVEARYRGKSKWYPGVIAKVRSGGYDVDYDDGEKEYNVSEENIRKKESALVEKNESSQADVGAFGVGDKVEAQYRGKSKWYPGVIAKVRSGGYDVDYDDGEKEYNVSEERIRSFNTVRKDEPEQGSASNRATDEFVDELPPTRPDPVQKQSTADDLNDFLAGLESDDGSELPDYGGGGQMTDEGDYGEDFED